jgi:hypothetical protein
MNSIGRIISDNNGTFTQELYNAIRKIVILVVDSNIPNDVRDDIIQSVSLRFWHKLNNGHINSNLDVNAYIKAMARTEIFRLKRSHHKRKSTILYDSELSDKNSTTSDKYSLGKVRSTCGEWKI